MGDIRDMRSRTKKAKKPVYNQGDSRITDTTRHELNIDIKPDRQCYICKNNEWWLRKGLGKPEWLCQTCHPKPR